MDELPPPQDIPSRVMDMSGKTIDRLTFEYFAYTENYRTFWVCKCDCGNRALIRRDLVVSGLVHSCGCLYKETRKLVSLKHGMVGTPEYKSWKHMMARCYNPNFVKYQNYGGRGIKVCDRWRNNFENFIEDMGLKPSPDHSIDRLDNNGDYCPENCRWATMREQANNRRTNRRVTINGVTKTVAEWSRAHGIDPQRVYSRLALGWDIHRALNERIRPRRKVNKEALAA